MRFIGKIFIYYKRAFYRIFIMNIMKKMLKKCGKNVIISPNCDLTYKNIEIGSNVYIGPGCYLLSPINKISVGSNVMFGPEVMVISSNHDIKKIGVTMFENSLNDNDTGNEIIIEDDVWIGARAIILQGVTVGKGSVIGAGAIVTKDIPSYSIYTGVPQKKVRKRFPEVELEMHLNELNKRMNQK